MPQMCTPRTGRRCAAIAAAALAAAALAAAAHAGPERLVIIVDPSIPRSMHVANHYIAARNVPATHVLYMEPHAANHAMFTERNLRALMGTLAQRGIQDQVDFILITPGAPYRLPVSSTIPDQCSTVRNFAIGSVYTMAHIADEVLAGIPVTTRNHYYSAADAVRFSSAQAWRLGQPSTDPAARRYFIGAMLGYTGDRGNTVPELLDLIDRSVDADGSRPPGVFYFMDNQNDPNRNVRAPWFPVAVNRLASMGGAGEVIQGVLPTGRNDALGIMTGASSPGILTANYGIRPGAFADHLTSYAGHFNNSSQRKMSEWIAKGASGSLGAVEEPCNYPGKFPTAFLHPYYFSGLTLGEAYFRSAGFVPFQMLLYGDPLTRAFSHIPDVQLRRPPTGPVSGQISLIADATTPHPTASIDRIDMLINGVFHSSADPGRALALDTTTLPDGHHDLRFIAYDDTPARVQGRWTGSITVDNHGRRAFLNVSPGLGDLATPFEAKITTSGAGIAEVRLVQAGRILAATAGSQGTLQVFGRTIGAANRRPVALQAEALFQDGSIVRSEPFELTILNSGGATGAPPVAFGYTRHASPDHPILLELPATFDDHPGSGSWFILSQPSQGAILPRKAGPYAALVPDPGAAGTDSLTFRVDTAAGQSNTATITIDYGGCYPDCDGNGRLDFFDFLCFQNAFLAQDPYADCDNNGILDFFDFLCFQNQFLAGCP